MNDLTKTAITVVLAAGLAGAVYVTRPVSVTREQFSDVGEPLFPGFTDPSKAAGLEVVAFDEATASYRPFKVSWDGKKWVIPSHHNYPADAKDNMAQAASAFVGVVKEVVASDRAADHEALGVLDPSDAAAPTSGRGTRVTIKDAAGATVVDAIIGKEAKGLASAEGGTNKRYVRLPNQARTYIVTFNKTFSTKFSDWAQTDLLQMQGQQVARMAIDRYAIDEQAGVKRTEERVLLSRDPAVGAGEPNFGWKLEASSGGGPGPGEQINLTKINEVSNALREMRIVGVRPKPEKLVRLFGGDEGSIALDALDQMNLRARGFFVTPKGQLLANEGQASYVTSDGVSYNMYFGEVLFGEGEAISSGADEPLGESKPEEAKEGEREKKGQETRYVFIDASVDPSVIPEPVAPVPPSPPGTHDPAVPAAAGAEGVEPGSEGKPPREPHEPGAGSEPEAAPQTGGPPEASPMPSAADEAAKEAEAALKAYEEAKKKYEADVADRKAKLEAAQKKVDGLKKKFAPWYYVIDAKSFNQLRPRRSELVQAAPPKSADGTPAKTVPGPLPNMAGFEHVSPVTPAAPK